MDKLDLDSASMKAIADKVNEIVDFVNEYYKEQIAESEKKINEILYGKYLTNEQLIYFLRNSVKEQERINSITHCCANNVRLFTSD